MPTGILLRLTFAFLIVLAVGTITVTAQSFTVAAWNLESGDSQTISLVKRVKSIPGVDIWGFSELHSRPVLTAMTAAARVGQPGLFKGIIGSTGNTDRLAIVYNSSRFTLKRYWELHDINIENRVRSPLVAHFEDRKSKKQFFFMVNHLYRGSAPGRHEQARLLNRWARGQSYPTISVGDFNFDVDADNPLDRDRGFDHLTEGDVFIWARPARLIRTQCSYNSVLDFVFVSGDARIWPHESTIEARDDDCPDDALQSDHRPVITTFNISTGEIPPPTLDTATITTPSNTGENNKTNQKALILERIRRMEKELADLKRLLEEIEP